MNFFDNIHPKIVKTITTCKYRATPIVKTDERFPIRRDVIINAAKDINETLRPIIKHVKPKNIIVTINDKNVLTLHSVVQSKGITHYIHTMGEDELEVHGDGDSMYETRIWNKDVIDNAYAGSSTNNEDSLKLIKKVIKENGGYKKCDIKITAISTTSLSKENRNLNEKWVYMD